MLLPYLAKMKKESIKGPISPRRTSRIQTLRQVAVATRPTRGSFETPEWILKVIVFDKRYSKWVHETFISDWTFFFLRFFEFSGIFILVFLCHNL